jgi:hypothetical protein
MTESQSDQVERFLRELREWTAENIRHYRTHVQQISILAGAIAAFLMPVYASQTSTIQRSLVAISIVMLLLCILIGMLHLWQIITSEAIDLKDMRISVEEKDEERKKRYDERKEKRLKRRDQPDLVNVAIHLLFSGAILVLVTGFVFGEYGL